MLIYGDKANIVFHRLSVNSVSRSSGIFVGTNHAHGWRSSTKDNYGFGEASDSAIARSVTLVYDNDVIDAPIEEHDQSFRALKEHYLGENHVQFQEINVNSLLQNTSVSIGENAQSKWNAHSKANMGLGEFIGMSNTQAVDSRVIDNDMVDVPVRSAGTIVQGRENKPEEPEKED